MTDDGGGARSRRDRDARQPDDHHERQRRLLVHGIIPAGTYPSVTASSPGYTPVTFAGDRRDQRRDHDAGLRAERRGARRPASVDTTQADFQTGVPTNCDLTGTPGNVTLLDATSHRPAEPHASHNGFGFTATNWAGQTFTPAVIGPADARRPAICSAAAAPARRRTSRFRSGPRAVRSAHGRRPRRRDHHRLLERLGGYYGATFASPADADRRDTLRGDDPSGVEPVGRELLPAVAVPGYVDRIRMPTVSGSLTAE